MSSTAGGGHGCPDDSPPLETFKVMPVTLLTAGIGEGTADDGTSFGRVMVLTVAGPDDGTYPLAVSLDEALHIRDTIAGLLRREGHVHRRTG
jgi:hypothetical protein